MNVAEKIKLKWVSSIVPGHPFRWSIPMSSGSGIKVVQMKDLKENGQVDWATTLEVSIESMMLKFDFSKAVTGKPILSSIGDVR